MLTSIRALVFFLLSQGPRKHLAIYLGVLMGFMKNGDLFSENAAGSVRLVILYVILSLCVG